MLSIIIPTLNEEHYLPPVLESIKRQSFKDYEIIVADADSTDKTVEIAKNYGCWVVPGGLPAKGRNEGAKVARGDTLLFLDADTILPDGFLEKITNEFRLRGLDSATCPIKPFGKSKFAMIYYNLFFNFPSLVLERIYPNGTGLIIAKKDLHQKIRGFNEELMVGEDHEYIRRTAKLGRYRVLKSDRFFWSERRFKKEGWFRTLFKYGLIGLHLIFLGPVKTDIFKYRYGHYEDKK